MQLGSACMQEGGCDLAGEGAAGCREGKRVYNAGLHAKLTISLFTGMWHNSQQTKQFMSLC
eukprot:8138754-Prorocentrum_lima.AAC.1